MPRRKGLDAILEAHRAAVDRFFTAHGDDLQRAAEEIATSLRAGGKALFFGNGGSAADAQHLAAELVNRMTVDRPALAAVALTTDSSVLTSIGNDAGYEQVFARQIEALGRPGDVGVALSTSGNSPSVLLALTRARERKLRTIGLLGRDGGPARPLCDLPLVVESPSTARIQEVHILAGHFLCEQVEALLFPSLAG